MQARAISHDSRAANANGLQGNHSSKGESIVKCLQCGSKHIAIGVRAVDHAHYSAPMNLSLYTYERPRAAFFKGTRHHPLFANVCGVCGFVMFSVSAVDAMRILKRTPRIR